MTTIYNRELSWLQFNDRVLQEARDPTVPLVQRLRFLGIFSNNQDEFIRVRVANIIRLAELKSKKPIRMTGGYTPAELLPLIDGCLGESRELFRQTWDATRTELETHGIRLVDETGLSEEQLAFCRTYFANVISIRLVPLLLRKSVEIPFLGDGKIYLAVKMTSGASSRYALLQMPVSEACPRFVVLPSAPGRTDVIFLDDIVRLFLDDIFFMFPHDTISAHTFKIVRDATLPLDDDVSKSLSEKMFQGLSKREHGRPVRLVYDETMPPDVLETIARKLGIRRPQRLQPGGRYHQMRDLMRFPRVNPALEEPRSTALLHPRIDPRESVLGVIRNGDVMLFYPYHTFNHFIDLLREAAVDPRVQSIHITLYRTAEHSKVIHALLSAAQNGKSVTAMVELKARFDEEQNIDNTDLLQQGGVKVVHSEEELKVHAKLLLIERREGNSLRGYVYVGTGNFNEDTARIYGDIGLLTADEAVVEDARKVFDFLQNTHKHPTYKKLLVAPYFMRRQIETIIDEEIRNARRGKPAWIHAKFNSLTDERMVRKFYEASRAGVEVRLLVRGACCLQAGVEGLSENIEVRSIVDKYLEHARVIIAACGGKPRSWIMSADAMTRNLERRVEVGVPIRDRAIHATLEGYFAIQWADNTKARRIAPPYHNDYVPRPDDAPAHRSQSELYDYFENLHHESPENSPV